MFRCYEHHCQLQNIWKTVSTIKQLAETCLIIYNYRYDCFKSTCAFELVSGGISLLFLIILSLHLSQ